jgi:hypothetical protein
MTDQSIPQVTGEALSQETAPNAGVAQETAESLAWRAAANRRGGVDQVVAEAIVWRAGAIRHAGVPQVLVEVLDTPRPGGPKLWLLRQPKLQFLGVRV